MMETHRPSECKWCGAGDARLRLNGWKVFRCGANYDVDVDEWTHGDTCADTLRDRIQRALNVLRVVDRYDTDGVDPDTWCGDDVAQVVDADIVDQVIQILERENNATD